MISERDVFGFLCQMKNKYVAFEFGFDRIFICNWINLAIKKTSGTNTRPIVTSENVPI